MFGKKKEEKEEVEEEDTYSINWECVNCQEDLELYIPCGTTVKDYVVNKKCEVCKCLMSKRL